MIFIIKQTVVSYNDIAITFDGDVSVEEAKKSLQEEGVIDKDEEVEFWVYVDGGGYKFIKFNTIEEDNGFQYTDSV